MALRYMDTPFPARIKSHYNRKATRRVSKGRSRCTWLMCLRPWRPKRLFFGGNDVVPDSSPAGKTERRMDGQPRPAPRLDESTARQRKDSVLRADTGQKARNLR